MIYAGLFFHNLTDYHAKISQFLGNGLLQKKFKKTQNTDAVLVWIMETLQRKSFRT
jgi:hypothetical protein